MPTTTFDFIRLGLYESKPILPIKTLAAGTYIIPMFTEGNSLLSSVYVRSISGGGSVKVNYYDFGPGNNDLPGERYDLSSHNLITTADTTDRILVTKLHNKPHIEIIVTGTVEMGIYLTVVASFASDLDTNMKLHEQLADLFKDKGLPAMGYDSSDGKFYFLPMDNGAVKITGSVSAIAGGKANPKNWIKTLAVANTEESIVFQSNVKEFTIFHDTACVVQYSWQSTESGSVYFPLRPHQPYNEKSIIASNLTLYLQSPKANTRVYIIEWT
jgi:hypothetical protein